MSASLVNSSGHDNGLCHYTVELCPFLRFAASFTAVLAVVNADTSGGDGGGRTAGLWPPLDPFLFSSHTRLVRAASRGRRWVGGA